MSTPDEILRGLDAEQRQAATALRGPVCIPVSYTHLTLPTIYSV